MRPPGLPVAPSPRVVFLALAACVGLGGCGGDAPALDGRYEGELSGGYAGLGRVVDGRATSVELAFTGAASARVAGASEGPLALELLGCSLGLAGDPAGELRVVPGEGTCAVPVGGTVGTVAARPTQGSARLAGGQLALRLRLEAPPREEGAPPASVTLDLGARRAP